MQNPNPSGKWTEHLKTQDQKTSFASALKQSKPVLERLQVILQRKLENLDSKLDNIDNLDLRDTAMTICCLAVRRKELKEIIKLIRV